MTQTERKPEWLKIKITAGTGNTKVKQTLEHLRLNTICSEANCPNRMECYHHRTATFLILGKNCTRGCRFCNVSKGEPEPVDESEPERVAQAAAELGLKHVVVTSVTRDDLPDGGAAIFARTITAIRQAQPQATVEVLIPDLKGDQAALAAVLAAKPDILNHNVETVPTLYEKVRPGADYGRSLRLLASVKELDGSIVTKSGFMLGLGETQPQVEALLRDLRGIRCDIVTIGQYLAPSRRHLPVADYVRPEVFERCRQYGFSLGIPQVVSSPLARSSYHAQQAYDAIVSDAIVDEGPHRSNRNPGLNEEDSANG